MLIIPNKRVALKYFNILFELMIKQIEFFYLSRSLFAKHHTSGVGFSIAILDRTKFGFYRFQRFVFIVVIVRSILLKLNFDKLQFKASQ